MPGGPEQVPPFLGMMSLVSMGFSSVAILLPLEHCPPPAAYFCPVSAGSLFKTRTAPEISGLPLPEAPGIKVRSEVQGGGRGERLESSAGQGLYQGPGVLSGQLRNLPGVPNKPCIDVNLGVCLQQQF